MSKHLLACVAAWALLSWIPVASAQSAGTGALTGVVTDPTGAVVPNVTITLTNGETNQTRSATTGPSGEYKFTLVPPGTYRVRFVATGFKSSEIAGTVINVTETPVLNRALEVGAQSEQITVEAASESIETASSTLGTVVGSRAVVQLPLTTRNYTQILGLSAGANVGVNNASNFGKGTQDISVNGANINQNNYQMDGVAVANFAGTGIASDAGIYVGIGIPNPDALQEFKIQTSTYDASYGRNPGANVNVITKSGTNSWHGSLFEFFRNKDLNANDFFRNRTCGQNLAPCLAGGGVKQILNQNQFGGTVGGPIKKDKMFFFVSYQETRQLNGVGTQGNSAPTLPLLPSGDRSNTAAFQAALGALWCPDNHANDPAAVLAKYKTQAGGIQVDCAGNNINPVAIKFLQLKLANGSYYIPGAAGSNFQVNTFSTPARFTEHQAVGNWDYLLNSKNTLQARFFTGQGPQSVPFSNVNGELPGTPVQLLYANTNAALKMTSIITNSFLNEARLSFQRNLATANNGVPFTATQLGMKPINSAIDVMNPITVSGYFNLGGGIGDDVFDPTDQFQISDTVSWSHGRHSFRAGFEVEHINWDIVYKGIERGNTTIASFPDFLIGRAGCSPAAVGCSVANPGTSNGSATSSNILQCLFCVLSGPDGIIHGYRVNDINWFVQDDYKVSSRLTLNLGVRWEYDGTLSDKYGNLTNVWESKLRNTLVPGSTPATGSLAGYVVPSNYSTKTYGPVPAGVFQSDRNLPVQSGPPKNNFGPRIGFAWQPFGSGRFVVRGGFGMFYDRIGGNQFVHSVEQGNPYAVTLDFAGSANQPSSLQQLFPAATLGFAPRWVNFANGTTSNLNLPFITENIHTPLTRQYNLTFQWEFVPKWVLDIGFVGSSGINQTDYGHNVNVASLASPSNPINGLTTNTVANANLRVPYLGYAASGLQVTAFDGIYNYNSMQATVRKQLSHGVSFQASYTYSKNLTTLAGYGANYNLPTNMGQQYGPSTFNRPQRLAVNYSWDIPFRTTGVAGKILGGWTASGLTILQDGVPLTITDTRAGSIYGVSGGSPTNPGIPGSNVVGRVQLCPGTTYATVASPGDVKARLGGASGGPGFFTASSFCAPPAIGNGTDYGNSGIGILLGPGQFNWDLSVMKMTRVGGLSENATLQFRSEFFNAFNHAQFSNPTVSLTSALFGQITTTSVSPRLIQFALKYTF